MIKDNDHSKACLFSFRIWVYLGTGCFGAESDLLEVIMAPLNLHPTQAQAWDSNRNDQNKNNGPTLSLSESYWTPNAGSGEPGNKLDGWSPRPCVALF